MQPCFVTVTVSSPCAFGAKLLTRWCHQNAGAYSSFLLHAHRAGERYRVPPHEILLEVGRRRYVGGQEDMIIGVALELAGDPSGALT